MSLFYSKLEMLPDEMLLEICKYLHSGDVLYSFFGLNYRLNRTITFYRQHVSLHRTFHMQFTHIFNTILPQIDICIRSLVIYELESSLFLTSFQNNHLYKNLEKLTLVNWTDKKLMLFLDTLHGMVNFRKLLIQALDLTSSIKHIILLKKIFSTNDNRLISINFDHECDAFNFSDNEKDEYDTIYPHIIELNIELQTTTDLSQLGNLIPNIEQLHITFKRPWRKISLNQNLFPYLKEFSVYAMSWFSTFDDLKTLIQISSNIIKLSLVLVSHDYSMVDKQRVYSLLPSSINQFHYSICYQPSDLESDFDSNEIIKLWKNIPIGYSINENDKRIFLHTIIYESNRLSLRSLFNKSMSAELNNQIYKNVRHLHIYDTLSLTEIFGILRHCRQILDLVISIRTLPSRNQELSKTSFDLPLLNRLDFLSIQGSPPDLNNIEKIFLVSPNLSAISIDFDCLYKLLIDENQTLYLFRLLYQRIVILCLRFEDTTIENLTDEHIHCIARIFSRVNHMCIDLRNSNIKIESSLISLILNYFPKLIVLSMYGQVSKDIESDNDLLYEYLIRNSTNRLINLKKFKIDYGYERVKIWL